jgi:putative flippase GtrA
MRKEALKDLIVNYKQIILYLFFGILTTAVNIGAYLLFTRIFYIDYILSNILAWFISVVFAYITNRIWVFESKRNNILLEFLLFTNGRILSGSMDSILLYIFVGLLIWDDLISKIIIGIMVVITNYLFSKLIVFKEENK